MLPLWAATPHWLSPVLALAKTDARRSELAQMATAVSRSFLVCTRIVAGAIIPTRTEMMVTDKSISIRVKPLGQLFNICLINPAFLAGKINCIPLTLMSGK